MNKYKISYFYLATGMEGHADEHPEEIIVAPNEDKAAYFYWITFDRNLNLSFNEFMSLSECHRKWGLTIKVIEDE